MSGTGFPSARARSDLSVRSKSDPGRLWLRRGQNDGVPRGRFPSAGSVIVDFVVEPEVCALERSGSPPGQELLGVITSHGPSRESYRSFRKSRGSGKATTPSAADAVLPAERVRGALPSAAGAPALLQRRVPGSGEGMVALEGAGKIPGDEGLQAATERSKPTLPGAREKPETARARGSSRGREGHHYRIFFSTIRATGLAATWYLSVGAEVLYNASARTIAGAPWSVSGNGSSAGSRRAT
jgi:hypothetical protein